MRRPQRGQQKNCHFGLLFDLPRLFRGRIRLSRHIFLRSRLVIAQIEALSAEFWPCNFDVSVWQSFRPLRSLSWLDLAFSPCFPPFSWGRCSNRGSERRDLTLSHVFFVYTWCRGLRVLGQNLICSVAVSVF